MNTYLLFALPWLLFTGATVARHTPMKNEKWDFLTFTQQWPQVACISWKLLNPSHQCNITPAINSWTIHGIWPSSYDKSSPAFCNHSKSFNMSEIQQLEPQLAIRWANVYANTPEDQLWAHEWNKHGTCAMELPQLQTEALFFQQGIEWSKQIDLLSILNDFGISPSSKTPILAFDVVKAIEKKLHVTPNVVCNYDAKHKTYYLFEIELCYDKTLKLMNCPSSAPSSFRVLGSTSCPPSKLVWYPEIEKCSQMIRQEHTEAPTLFQSLFKTYMKSIMLT